MKLQSTVCMAASLWGVWANAAPGDVKWSNAEDGPCTSGGAIDNAGVAAGDNGQIYFVSAAREWTLFAADGTSGDQAWNLTFPDTESASSPAYERGKVYYLTATADSKVQLRAMAAKTGKRKWITTLPSASINDAPVAGGNGLLYVLLQPLTSGDKTLHAINASTGDIVWSQAAQGTPSRPAIAHGNVYVSVGQADGNKEAGWASTDLVAYDALTGEHKWTSANMANQWATPLIVDDLVYTSAEETDFYALNAHTGKQVWHATVDGYNALVPCHEGDNVFVTGAMSAVYAFNAKTGKEIWSTVLNPSGHLWAVPTVVNGVVYVGGDDSNLHALDAATGKVQWKRQVGEGEAVGSPVVANGLVYVGSNSPWGVASPDQLYAVEI